MTQIQLNPYEEQVLFDRLKPLEGMSPAELAAEKQRAASAHQDHTVGSSEYNLALLYHLGVNEQIGNRQSAAEAAAMAQERTAQPTAEETWKQQQTDLQTEIDELKKIAEPTALDQQHLQIKEKALAGYQKIDEDNRLAAEAREKTNENIAKLREAERL